MWKELEKSARHMLRAAILFEIIKKSFFSYFSFAVKIVYIRFRAMEDKNESLSLFSSSKQTF